jgi:hypothetical protein
VTEPIVYKRADAGEAAAIGLLWAMADARRRGEAVPREVEDSTHDALSQRLADPGACAVVGWHGDEPVVACFGTQAVIAPYAFEWGEWVRMRGGRGLLGQVTPPA